MRRKTINFAATIRLSRENLTNKQTKDFDETALHISAMLPVFCILDDAGTAFVHKKAWTLRQEELGCVDYQQRP